MCCDDGRKPGTCCSNATEVFTLAAPFSSITAGPARPTSLAAAASSATSTSSDTITFVLRKTVTPGTIYTASTQAVPTQPVSTAAAAASGHHGPNVGAGVGGAVGGAVLLASLISLLCLVRRRRKKRATERSIKDGHYELPSDDPTLGQNSMLFPAELHPQGSKSALSPAELETKESKASKASPNPAELSATEQSSGPYELHGKEINTVEVPTSPLGSSEATRGPSSHYSGDAKWDDRSAVDGSKGTGVGIKRPPNRHNPDSMSGPWHDTYDKTNVP